MPKKKIVIDGEIGWDVYASGLRKQFEEAGNSEVEIELSSPGGFVSEGLTIHDIIKKYNNEVAKVTIIQMGLAASMATHIMMSVPKSQRKAYDNSIFMIHNPWGIEIGDYRVMEKYSIFLKSLATHLAKSYLSETDYSANEMEKMMDDESWFFGNEILNAGFIGEIIENPENVEEEAKTEMIAVAKLKVKDMFARMEKSEKAKKDLERAVALLPKNNITDTKLTKKELSEIETHIDSGDISKAQEIMLSNIEKLEKQEIKQEVNMPKLKELLAENPDAKKEYDEDIQKAKSEGIEAGKTEMQNKINKVVNYIGNENYPGIDAHAKKVLSGESSLDSLEGAVTAYDMLKGKKESEAAKQDTDEIGDTKPDTSNLTKDGVINNVADIKATAARIKGGDK